MESLQTSILIVDDSPRAIARLREIYLQLGWDVKGVAHNGVEALQFLEQHAVDWISLDIIMPLMDGIETYQKIKQRKISSECFFVSVLAGEPRVVQAYANSIPAERLLSKNLSDEALAAVLKRMMSQFASATVTPPGEHSASKQV